jgi:hypothetical protein
VQFRCVGGIAMPAAAADPTTLQAPEKEETH